MNIYIDTHTHTHTHTHTAVARPHGMFPPKTLHAYYMLVLNQDKVLSCLLCITNGSKQKARPKPLLLAGTPAF